MNGVSGYRFGSDPSNIAHIITFSFFMSSKPRKDSLHESSEEATARRKRTLAELKQLSKCYRHNSDLLHATFALTALRSDMRKKLRGREEIEEVNVAGDDGDELHRDDGVFRATSDDDESYICANVILPGELTPVTINGHLIGFHHLVEEALVVLRADAGGNSHNPTWELLPCLVPIAFLETKLQKKMDVFRKRSKGFQRFKCVFPDQKATLVTMEDR